MGSHSDAYVEKIFTYGSIVNLVASRYNVSSFEPIKVFTPQLRFLLQFLVSDAIVLWRAWVLYPANQMIKTILVICMLGTCGNSTLL